jgi:hypothetical protein
MLTSTTANRHQIYREGGLSTTKDHRIRVVTSALVTVIMQTNAQANRDSLDRELPLPTQVEVALTTPKSPIETTMHK